MARPAADSSVFYAVADPTRRAILGLLRGVDRPVKDLFNELRIVQITITPSALSQHLAVLRSAGLVADRRAGRQRVYSLQTDALVEVADWIALFEPFWQSRLDRLGQYLDRLRTEGPAAESRGLSVAEPPTNEETP